jgi:hypothetical protein
MVKEVTVYEKIDDSVKLQDLINTTGNTGTKYIFPEDHNISVSSKIRVYNNTEFDGTNTTFELNENVSTSDFGIQVPIIGSKYSTGILGINFHDIIFEGNRDTQKNVPLKNGKNWGQGYHNFLGFGNLNNPVNNNVTNCNFYNITFNNNLGDGCRIEGGQNINFWGITGKRGGHDVIHLNQVTGFEVSNCEVWTEVNNFIRTRSSSKGSVHDCIGHGTKQAYSPWGQFESIIKDRSSSGISIHNNYIEDSLGPGIWLAGNVPGNKDISIYNNIFYKCGLMPSETKISGVGGVIMEGFDNVRILNNTFVDCLGHSVGNANYQIKNGPSGMSATVQGNIFYGTDKSLYEGPGSGATIGNVLKHYKFNCSGNCFYINYLDLYNCTSSDDIYLDPLFVDYSTGDYHLQSEGGHWDTTSKKYIYDKKTSPCVTSSGEKGAYANTLEASLYIPPNLPYVQIPRRTLDDLRELMNVIYELNILEKEERVEFGNVPKDWEV